VTEGVHLAVNHMRGYSLCKPLNISWISKSICVTLEQGDWQTEVFNRNLWWCELTVSLYVLLWPIIEHREVFSHNVLGKINQILVGATSGSFYEQFGYSAPVVFIQALTNKTLNDTLTKAFGHFAYLYFCFSLPPV